MRIKKYVNGGKPPIDPKNPLKLDPSAKKAVQSKPVSSKTVKLKPKSEDSTIENVIEIIDPTGLTSWDDVKRSYDDTGLSGETALEVLGALPILGKAGKLAKAGIHLKKYKGLDKVLYNSIPKSSSLSNTLRGAAIAGRASDATQAATQYGNAPLYPKFKYGGKMLKKYSKK